LEFLVSSGKFTQIGIFGLEVCHLATMEKTAPEFFLKGDLAQSKDIGKKYTRALHFPAGLPDFSLYKTGKNVPNKHRMCQTVLKYPECP
jgi:hypothetical protein